ncbi:MAG: tetratricopeptide repeat protein [Acidobacteriota bacterium]
MKLWLLAILSASVFAQADDAYAALRAKDYDRAVAGFREVIAQSPAQASLRTDLAYTLLKIGDSVGAREQFGEAMRIDPDDDHVALEYAFLCYEAPELKQTARRVFDRLRQKGNATAIEAFENVDRPLREGIARWQDVVQQDPRNFSAHEELARLAEQRDELSVAADHYAAAWKLRPERRDLLVDLGRVWHDQGRLEQSMAAWLAASRSLEPRVAEAARALLPERYPYVYEFEQALALDPANDELRRELAYLHQAMGNQEAAQSEFEHLRRESVPTSKFMAERSLEKGYLLDAARYLKAAYEDDPNDWASALKLGWTYNILKNDEEAVRWFEIARHSPDLRIAEEATGAYESLAPALRRLQASFWMFPMISTRWRDTFAYAQAKLELRLGNLPLRPYASVRFVGDLRGSVQPIAGLAPQYLSERSVIVAAGLATRSWQGAALWIEAGTALHYSGSGRELDIRGGLSFYRRGSRARWFAETNDDALYVRRFNRDGLLYSQNRTGWTLSDTVQFYWNWNLTADLKREYWANTAETGPGVRWRVNGVELTANFLRGAYLRNVANPYRPNYNDLRIGIWYAFHR